MKLRVNLNHIHAQSDLQCVKEILMTRLIFYYKINRKISRKQELEIRIREM